eukprot:555135-Prymnesium_polylepis.2
MGRRLWCETSAMQRKLAYRRLRCVQSLTGHTTAVSQTGIEFYAGVAGGRGPAPARDRTAMRRARGVWHTRHA